MVRFRVKMKELVVSDDVILDLVCVRVRVRVRNRSN